MINNSIISQLPSHLKKEFSKPRIFLKLFALDCLLLLINALILGFQYGFFGNSQIEKSFAAAPTFPYGADLLAHPEKLPQLRPQVIAKDVSSHDKTGLNWDNGHQADDGQESYLYKENNNYVLVDEKGPGTLTRFRFGWALDDPIASAHIKFYLDGETNPRIDLPLKDLFSGQSPPFVKPLVCDHTACSGSYVSYLPISFANSLKVTIDQFPTYYQFNFEKYDPSVTVSSFTGSENYSAIISQWQNLGNDPKPIAGNQTTSGTVPLAAGQKATIREINNQAGTINAVKISIPQVVPAAVQDTLGDDGRSHSQNSSFNVSIDPSNQGVKLKRRMDYGVGNQKGKVYVDGELVGEWFTPGSNTVYRWRDETFDIPQTYTAGKSNLTIQIDFVSSDSNWTEFNYWVYSKVASQEILSDRVDVGNSQSESDHSYQITSSNFFGYQYYTYPLPTLDQAQTDSKEILSKVKIKAYWDNEAAPSVDVPIGSFFGSIFGETEHKSLFLGMSTQSNGFYYNYYPMPYNSNAKIEIVNESGISINLLSYEIVNNPAAPVGLGSNLGYFKASFRQEIPAVAGNDFKIANIPGQGQIVGIVYFAHALAFLPPPYDPVLRNYLEGDERFYFDGSATPDTYGTSTEEFFNGGWYFDRGFVTNPLASFNYHRLRYESTAYDETGAYRIFFGDAQPFRNGADLRIEHGDAAIFNTRSAHPGDFYAATFWYGLNKSQLEIVDEIDVGSPISEIPHNYTPSASSIIKPGNYAYEGDNDLTFIPDNVREEQGNLSFNVYVNQNKPIIIRRRLDYGIRNQQAKVFVDNVEAGTWYTPGRNSAVRWRDDQFYIPSDFTTNKTNINIRIEPQNSTWTAARYWIYSVSEKPTPLFKLRDPDVPIGNPANEDGIVDTKDISQVISAYGKRSTMPNWNQYEQYDLNLNGFIGADDISIANIAFGSLCWPIDNPNSSCSENSHLKFSEGKTINFSTKATNASDSLSYTIEGLPPGACFNTVKNGSGSFNCKTNQFSWMPNYNQAGTYAIRITANNGTTNYTKTLILHIIDIPQ